MDNSTYNIMKIFLDNFDNIVFDTIRYTSNFQIKLNRKYELPLKYIFEYDSNFNVIDAIENYISDILNFTYVTKNDNYILYSNKDSLTIIRYLYDNFKHTIITSKKINSIIKQFDQTTLIKYLKDFDYVVNPIQKNGRLYPKFFIIQDTSNNKVYLDTCIKFLLPMDMCLKIKLVDEFKNKGWYISSSQIYTDTSKTLTFELKNIDKIVPFNNLNTIISIKPKKIKNINFEVINK